MYGIWRKIGDKKSNKNNINTDGIKQYIGQVNSSSKAMWIYYELDSKSDIAISHNGNDIWYGFNPLKEKLTKIHMIENPKKFVRQYINNFSD